MLKDILREMAKGNVRSQAELARRLEIDQAMLSHMLRELTRRGYLSSLEATQAGSCSLGCDRCGARSACGVGEPAMPNGWVLTEKGRRLAGA